ncbi:hypothetical protein AGMMS49982_23910 [Bacteroidia bacterium]|nr:hypothetical protein AGMMS49982_23910 [Bacteroidia bacterium]
MNKKVFFMAALAASVSVFSGCSDDEPAAPAAKDAGAIADESKNVEGGAALNTKIDSVKVIVWYDSGSGVTTYELLKEKYEDGGFALNWPTTVPSELLDSVLPARQKADWLTVSGDAGAKKRSVRDILAFKGNMNVGNFFYTNTAPSATNSYPREAERDTTYENTSASVTFVYADKAISASGSAIERDTTKQKYVNYGNGNGYFNRDETGDYTRYDIDNITVNQSLKPGWNAVYQEETTRYVQTGRTITVNSTQTMTTTVPGGLKWYFQPNSNFAAIETAAKILANRTYTGTADGATWALTFTSATAYTLAITGEDSFTGTWEVSDNYLYLESEEDFFYFQIENSGNRLVGMSYAITLTH